MPSPNGGFSSGEALAMMSLRASASSIDLISDGVSSGRKASSSLSSLVAQNFSATARGVSAARAWPTKQGRRHSAESITRNFMIQNSDPEP
jgi:hypothetical protein